MITILSSSNNMHDVAHLLQHFQDRTFNFKSKSYLAVYLNYQIFLFGAYGTKSLKIAPSIQWRRKVDHGRGGGDNY